jgi:hypothetical protein
MKKAKAMQTQPRSLGRQRTFDMPHSMSKYPAHQPALVIHNHIPAGDDDPDLTMPETDFSEEASLPAGAERSPLPAWFEQHRSETADRFKMLDDAVRELHTMLNKHYTRGDEGESVFDPEVSGEVREGEQDHRIHSTSDINRLNRIKHGRATRDIAPTAIRTLADLNTAWKSRRRANGRTGDMEGLEESRRLVEEAEREAFDPRRSPSEREAAAKRLRELKMQLYTLEKNAYKEHGQDWLAQ